MTKSPGQECKCYNVIEVMAFLISSMAAICISKVVTTISHLKERKIGKEQQILSYTYIRRPKNWEKIL